MNLYSNFNYKIYLVQNLHCKLLRYNLLKRYAHKYIKQNRRCKIVMVTTLGITVNTYSSFNNGLLLKYLKLILKYLICKINKY